MFKFALIIGIKPFHIAMFVHGYFLCVYQHNYIHLGYI